MTVLGHRRLDQNDEGSVSSRPCLRAEFFVSATSLVLATVAPGPFEAAARACIDEDGRLFFNDSSVTSAVRQRVAAIAAAMAQRATPEPARTIVQRGARFDDCRFIVVEPAQDPDAHAPQPIGPVRVCVLAPAAAKEPDPAVLGALFGLTNSEAKVAAAIGAGLTPREAAARLEIQEGTVRVVLKKVFAKTGVSRQPALTLLLARIPARCGIDGRPAVD